MQRRSTLFVSVLTLAVGGISGCRSAQEAAPPASEPVPSDDVLVAEVSDGPTERLDESAIARVADALDQQLVQQVIACRQLSDNSLVRGFYARQEYPHRTLNALRDTVARSSAIVASLVDANGVVTLSTDPNAEGYEFSRWSSFKAGIAGEVLVFPVVGFVAENRGLFVIVPHENEQGEPIGVVVLRSVVTHLDGLLDGISAPAALVYRDRYALATNRPELGFHGLRGLDERGGTAEFTDGNLFDVLDTVVPAVGETVTEDGVVYAIERIPMVLPDWTLLVAREE